MFKQIACKYLNIIGRLLIFAFIVAGCKSTGNEEFNTSAWENNIFHRIGEAPVGGGFAMDDYWVWVHDDIYILIYMGSTHPFADVTNPDTLTLASAYTTVARSNKRIGIATSKSPYGPWERRDKPILEPKPGTFYSFFTSNPSPCINEDGSVLLMFKSRSYKGEYPFHSKMMIGVARAASIEGPFEVIVDEPIFGVDKMGQVEDPFLWKDANGYHMMAKDHNGTITGNRQAGILAHSTDGINWILDVKPLAYTREVSWSDGKTIEMGQLERVFGLVEDGKITHLFFATMDGPGGFQNGTRS